MSATVIAIHVLHCDAYGCTTTFECEPGTALPQVRARARREGWMWWPGNSDACAVHAPAQQARRCQETQEMRQRTAAARAAKARSDEKAREWLAAFRAQMEEQNAVAAADAQATADRQERGQAALRASVEAWQAATNEEEWFATSGAILDALRLIYGERSYEFIGVKDESLGGTVVLVRNEHGTYACPVPP